MGPRLLVGVQGFWRTPIDVSQEEDIFITEDSVRVNPTPVLRRMLCVNT